MVLVAFLDFTLAWMTRSGEPNLLAALLAVTMLPILLPWGCVTYAKALAEAHEFSAWRGLVTAFGPILSLYLAGTLLSAMR